LEFSSFKLGLSFDDEKKSMREKGEPFINTLRGPSILVGISGGFLGVRNRSRPRRYVTHGTVLASNSIFERYLVTGGILWNGPEHPCTFSWRDSVTILSYRWLSSHTSQSCFAMRRSRAESSCERAAKLAKSAKRCGGVFTKWRRKSSGVGLFQSGNLCRACRFGWSI